MAEPKEVERLKRSLARESAAREEAEDLLEQRSSELFEAYRNLEQELSRVIALQAAIDTSTDGIAYTDAEGCFLYMNTAHAKMFGYDAAELMGQSWATLYAADELQRFDSEIMPLFGRDGYWRGEAVGQSKSGSRVLQEIALSALPTGGIICSTRDIEERQRKERLARETSALITADEQRATVNTIVAGVAHDFNNLVSAINGYAELLMMETAEQPKLCDRASSIKAAADQAASLVGSLEHIDQTEPVDFDLVETIHECVGIVGVLKPPTISIEMNLPKNARLVGEPILVSRAILNILKNAFEAMTSGGQIRLILEHADDELIHSKDRHVFRMGNEVDPPYWRFRVQDNGPGIAPEDLHRIFDVGFSTKDRMHNSGLGMNSLVMMQEAHDMSVTVTTCAGQGTEFIFDFADLGGDRDLQAKPDVEQSSGQRILVVDDNVSAGQSLCELLEHLGYSTDFQDSPIKALARIRDDAGAYGLVISDFDMPALDGLQMSKILVEDYPNIPVLIYSGRTIRSPGSENVLRILKKPVGTDVLREVLPYSPPPRLEENS